MYKHNQNGQTNVNIIVELLSKESFHENIIGKTKVNIFKHGSREIQKKPKGSNGCRKKNILMNKLIYQS